MISARNRCPFTPNQWQQLEHQALMFKYLVSGVPIPPQLIYSVKTSLDSSLASHLFPHQPIGWGCFQVGFGRKADAAPGRCRRTDGKKWRCSKQAYPDSKYCERHMHRGRNRSRKPVEVNSTATTTTTSVFSPSFSSINSNLPISTSSNCSQPSISSFSSSPMASEIYTHHHNLNHFLDSGTGIYYSQADKDYRYVHNGARKGVDERSFFPSYQPLTVSSYKSYPQSENQGFGDNGSK